MRHWLHFADVAWHMMLRCWHARPLQTLDRFSPAMDLPPMLLRANLPLIVARFTVAAFLSDGCATDRFCNLPITCRKPLEGGTYAI